MRVVAILTNCFFLFSHVRADGDPAPSPTPPAPTPTVPAPTPTVPATCSVCAGASSLGCVAPGLCACEVNGVFNTCDYDECCVESISTCCGGGTDDGYFCETAICGCFEVLDGYTPTRNKCPLQDNGDRSLQFGFGFGDICPTGGCLNYNTCCPGFPRATRNLKESSDVVLNSEGLQELKAACGNEDYQVSIYMEHGHIYSLATPLDDATQCPHLAAHALFGPKHYKVAQKQALLWGSRPDLENEPHVMGTFQAVELIDAFERAEPSGPGAYHAVTNNCANLHINLAQELGVKIDAQVVSYVTQHLMQDAGSSFLKYLRESWSGGVRRSLQEEDEMVQKIVEERVSELL